MKKKQSNPLTKIFLAFPDAVHPYLFILTQYLYALLTMAPAYYYYNSFVAHTMFILFIVFLSVFNGADYYIEVFSLRYRVELNRLEKQASVLSPILTATDADELTSPSSSCLDIGKRNASASSLDELLGDDPDDCPISAATTTQKKQD
jgi:hypothetical protein